MNSLSLKAVVTIISFHVSAVASFAQSPCPAPKGEVPETAKNIIAEFQAWSVFVETDPDECFAAADPVETTIEPVTALENLCIGASSLTVAYWPKREVNGQLSFRSGYEFDPTVAIEFIINDKSYPLIAEKGGQIAWPKSADEDRNLISLMRHGSRLAIIAKSTNGANIKDTYSLSGFASAIDLAARACSSEFHKLPRIVAHNF